MTVSVLGASAAWSQTVETGFLNRALAIDGVEYRYQVYVPREYRSSQAWPVILALHGGGERGTDGLIQTDVGLGRAIRRHADRFPAIVVFPQRPRGDSAGWQDGARFAIAALDKTLTEFNADRSRIYLTGLSMGGNGSWYLAYHHADRFAAAVIICGWVSERRSTTVSTVAYPAIAPAAEGSTFDAVAKQVTRLPIWIFHGDADATVPVAESRGMAEALRRLKGDVQYTELPGVGHNSWDPAYDRADVIEWLLKQRRP
jgi:predicted peptidase